MTVQDVSGTPQAATANPVATATPPVSTTTSATPEPQVQPAKPTTAPLTGPLAARNHIVGAFRGNQPTLETRDTVPSTNPQQSPATPTPAPVVDATAKPAEPVTDPTAPEATATPDATKTDETATSPEVKEESTANQPDNEEWFFLSDSTRYKTPDDAKKGIRDTQAYVGELKSQLETVTKRVAELEPLAALSQHLTDDQVKAHAVQKLIPEEYRGKTADDFVEEAELRKFMYAQAKAEAQYEAQLQTERTQKEAEQKTLQEKATKAAQWVKETATAEFFDVKTPQEYETVFKQLATQDASGFTALDKARMIAEAFDVEAGKLFLLGVKREIRGDTQARVREVVTSTTPIPTPTVQPPVNPSTPPLNARQHITGGFKTTPQKVSPF